MIVRNKHAILPTFWGFPLINWVNQKSHELLSRRICFMFLIKNTKFLVLTYFVTYQYNSQKQI